MVPDLTPCPICQSLSEKQWQRTGSPLTGQNHNITLSHVRHFSENVTHLILPKKFSVVGNIIIPIAIGETEAQKG